MNNGEKEFFSLHGHARNNNVEEMIKLLNSRENVNAKDKLHRTPLHLACYAGSLDAARLLIESGADVNAIGMDGVRPLAFAVMKNHIEIVRLLLTNGAVSGINARFNKDSATCLLVAAKNNNKDMVKLLLDMGSNPNLSNKQGQRPIDVCSDEDIKKMISEYTKKWNDEKKKQVAERRKNKRLYREQKEKEKEKKEKEEEEEEREKGQDSEHTNPSEPTESAPKKLDLKRLAIALNDDSD